MKTLLITKEELMILESIIEEHEEAIGSMDDNFDILQRQKEINKMKSFIKRNYANFQDSRQ